MFFIGQGLLGLPKADMLQLKAKMTEAQKKNQLTLMSLFNYYANIGITRYDWTGLPSSVDERFLNTALFMFGKAAFFKSDEMGFMALPCTPAGEYNAYYNPTAVNAFSFNFNKMLRQDEFVYMRANPSTVPLSVMCFEIIERMSDTLRAMDVERKNLKRPYIMTCDEKEKRTILTLYTKIDDNEPLIIGQKNYGLDKSRVEIIPTKTQNNLDSLWNLYKNYENMLYTVLGIESVAHEKKERLIVDEVNSNNMVTEMSSEVELKELRSACEEINKKWDLNVSVTAKSISDYKEGVKTVGELYDNPQGTD